MYAAFFFRKAVEAYTMEQGTWQGIMVWLEWEEKDFHPSSYEMLSEAKRLSCGTGEDVYAVGIGRNIHAGKEKLKGYGIKRAVLHEVSTFYLAETYANIFAEYLKKIRPGVVLIGGTMDGRALAARLAVLFRTGLTADCTALSLQSDGRLVQTRPAFGGNLMAEIETKTARPQLATVRPGIMEAERERFDQETFFDLEKGDEVSGRMRVLQEERLAEAHGIADAKRIIAVGRGIRKREDLAELYALAEKMGAVLASSRALVEKGWMKNNEQIGLSGTTVHPELLITLGISGSVQFLAGIRQAKHIIAVNTDPEARIFQIAHDPICADLYDVLPELLKRL